ncbi:MAG: SLC13/DASS family transporter [Candidatus Heimdallarchaeota archaeon]|nr:SLC13/DASS family transporter [Candidatus Heimdallarchaeota archaeon]
MVKDYPLLPDTLDAIVDELKRDIHFNRKKFLLALIALILFVSGYIIAPNPIPDGQYTVEVSYQALTAEFSINVDSDLDFPTNQSIIYATDGTDTIKITYWKFYPGKVGEVIFFNAEEFNNGILNQEIGIEDYTGQILDSKKIVSFSGSSVDDGNVLFEVRILKNSDIGLGLLLLISFLWLTELVPLAASSLIIPVVIVLSDIDTSTAAFKNFANPIIFLFLAGFLMAEAMDRSGLDKFLSYRIIAAVPAKPKFLMLTFMALAAFFSMFMSNTAAVAILIPISLTIIKSAELEDESYKKTMVLGIAYSATVGGIGTLIGTAPNIIAAEFLKSYNATYDINFLEWMMFGVPVVIIMVPLVFFYLWFVFKPDASEEKLKIAKEKSMEKVKKEKMNLDQFLVSITFVIIITLWLTSQWHGISTSVVAVLGAVLFFFTGQVTNEDLREINWPTLITFGGGLSLGYVIIETGLADYIASKLGNLGSLPMVLIMTIIALVALLLTAIASNTASAAILIPIAMPLAIVLNLNPIVLAILIAITCSLDFAIVIGTPPTMMAYNTGLYEVKEIFRIGIVLDLVGLLLVLILSWTLFFLLAGIVI